MLEIESENKIYSSASPIAYPVRTDMSVQPIKTKLTKHIGNQRFGSGTDAVRSKVHVPKSSNRDDRDAQFVMHTIRRQTKQSQIWLPVGAESNGETKGPPDFLWSI